MPHPAWYVLTLGIAVGTVLYTYFSNNRAAHRHDQQQWQYDYDEPPAPNYDNYNNPQSEEKLDEKCTICLDTVPRKNRRYLECGHFFHQKCLAVWLHERKVCPNCRSPTKYRE